MYLHDRVLMMGPLLGLQMAGFLLYLHVSERGLREGRKERGGKDGKRERYPYFYISSQKGTNSIHEGSAPI